MARHHILPLLQRIYPCQNFGFWVYWDTRGPRYWDSDIAMRLLINVVRADIDRKNLIPVTDEESDAQIALDANGVNIGPISRTQLVDFMCAE